MKQIVYILLIIWAGLIIHAGWVLRKSIIYVLWGV